MTNARRAVAAAGSLVTCLALWGCSESDGATATTPSTETPTASPEPDDEPTASEPSSASPTQAACFDDVTGAAIPPELSNLMYPDLTIVYNVDVRGDNGVMVTGVTSELFQTAVRQMRLSYQAPPFSIVSTAEGDTAYGATWEGPSISGRWEVSDISSVCPGNTQVRILWTADG